MKAIATFLVLGALASAVPQRSRRGPVDTVAPNSIPLRRVVDTQPSQLHRVAQSPDSVRNLAADGDPRSTNTESTRYPKNVNYLASLKVGDEHLEVMIDTATSDTWLVTKGYTCFDEDDIVRDVFCAFGPTYNGTYRSADLPRWSVSTIDGTSLSGRVGYQNIGIAGLVVDSQQMIFVDQADWRGNGVISGSLGLAYPITTRVFKDPQPLAAYPGSSAQVVYDTALASIYNQNPVTKSFSLTMDKKSQTGWLSFGGLPPVVTSQEFGATPIRVVGADGTEALRKQLSYFTIVPENWIYGDRDITNYTYDNPYWTSNAEDVKEYQFPVIIDSGSSYSYLPGRIVREYASQIPGPVKMFQGNYWVPCDAQLPKFATVIGGKEFTWQKQDLLLQDIRRPFVPWNAETAIDFCVLGILDFYPDGPYILGDNFLNGVVSVFDIGASEMRFYNRIGL